MSYLTKADRRGGVEQARSECVDREVAITSKNVSRENEASETIDI